jgi:hypothetical protein
MELHEFRLGGRLALTKDKTGSVLPGNGWAFVQTIDFTEGQPRIGAPYEEVMAAINHGGFFMWPVED